ncbi:MAG: YgiQ family radical SAM protein [Candidatus Cloacimonadaceae bacterium]
MNTAKNKISASFLPTSSSEMAQRGWKQCDFIIITGDAYIDHPSFGAAIISRVLEKADFKVGIIAQPDWKSDNDWLELGAPKYAFGITAGNLDSMVNHYTAQKKLRHNDAYSPEGKFGLRPDRATIIYCNKVRQIYKGVPIIIGGLEASLRRIAHYDFWQDKVRNPVLADAKADILIYGMAEKPLREIALKLKKGIPLSEMKNIKGTVVFDTLPASTENCLLLPPAEECSDKQTFYTMTKLFHANFREKIIYQQVARRFIRHNPPPEPLTEKELDAVYSLPYTRLPHPKYGKSIIPAWVQIKDSITTHRGCVGGCNFCSIGYHQGKAVQSRSETSILQEINKLTRQPFFKGTVSDLGGPSANMYGLTCHQDFPLSCKRNSCLYPNICSNLEISQQRITELLKQSLQTKGVKHVYVASGIRFDLALHNPDYIKQIALYHTGGLLKLAPEHTEPEVLKAMGKPEIKMYTDFCKIFHKITYSAGKKSGIVPYLIAGHPGCTLDAAIRLGLWLKQRNIRAEQVQEFTPTPMTISTCMYYTGLDFETGKPIYVPKGREIRLQKALITWHIPKNKPLIAEALKKENKVNLLGKFYN